MMLGRAVQGVWNGRSTAIGFGQDETGRSHTAVS